MKIMLMFLFFLFGVGRNLPGEILHLYGVGLVDCLFICLLIVALISAKTRAGFFQEIKSLKSLHVAVATIIIFALLSLIFNMFIFGAKISDVFEIFRYYFSFIILAYTVFSIKRYGVSIIIGFPVGVILTGIVAIINPMNPDVLGIPQIFNPNVIGNALAVSVLFSSVLILAGYATIGSAIAVLSSCIAFFTFSKGAWLMCTLALVACVLALKLSGNGSQRDKIFINFSKLASVMFLLTLIYVVHENYELISLVVEAKIKATEFGATAAEGGSFSARVGLILSAIKMFLYNPLFGVGISNFESVNRSLEAQLGSYFYDDDNPNSAFFYVLGCMGVVAFIAFSYLYYYFIKRLSSLVTGPKIVRISYATMGTGVIFIGGNVQLEMLTAYYFWVLFGLVISINHILSKTTKNIDYSQ